MLKKHWFKFTLAALAVVLAVVIGFLFHALWESLVAYEAASEVGAVTEYFGRFAQGDYDTAADSCGIAFDHKISRDGYIRYLQETYGSDFSDLRFAGRDGENEREKIYRVYSGDTLLGSVRLIPAQGARNWHVISEYECSAPITVVAPSFVTVTANGVAVAPDESKPAELDGDFKNLAELFAVPSKVTYTVDGFLYAPEISGTAPDGTICLNAVAEDGVVTMTVPPTEEQKAEYEALMTDFAKRYACYIAKDASFNQLRSLMDRTTPLYEAVRTFDNHWYNDHSGYEFRDMTVSDVVRPGEGYFAGTVRFDHVVFWRGEEKIYKSAYRLSFRLTEEGNWLLVDMAMA